MKTKMKTKVKAKTVAKKTTKAEAKKRRVGAKCKKTRLKREMAKERIEEQGFEREEGLVCMGESCFCHRLDMGYKGMKSRCDTKKEGGKCDAMF
jgi:hypothetical protein